MSFYDHYVVYTSEEIDAAMATEGFFDSTPVQAIRSVLSGLNQRIFSLFKNTPPTNHLKEDVLAIQKFALDVQKRFQRPDQVYLSHRELLVNVPENLQTAYAVYSKDLVETLETHSNKAQSALTQVNHHVGDLINEPKNRTSTFSLSSVYGDVRLSEKEIQKMIARHFSKNTGSLRPLLSVLPVLSDLTPLLSNVERLASLLTVSHFARLEQSVKALSQNLTVLERELSNQTITTLSPAAAKNIGSGTYYLAQYVEQVSLLAFQGTQLIQATLTLLKKLRETK